MRSTIMKLFELNEGYHETKEKMAWAAATLYLGFGVAVILRVIDHPLPSEQSGLALGLIWIVYVTAMAFATFQYKCRWDSVDKSGALGKVLRSGSLRDLKSSYPKMLLTVHQTDEVAGARRMRMLHVPVLTLFYPVYLVFCIVNNLGKDPSNRHIFDSRYRTEIPTYVLMTYIFVSQRIALIMSVTGSS